MPFEKRDFEDLRQLVKIAREAHVLTLSMGGISVGLHPESWIYDEKPAAAAGRTLPKTPKERAEETRARLQINGKDVDESVLFASAGDDESARRMMPGYIPREPEAG